MASAAQAYKHYKNTLGETDSATIAAKANMDAYKSEYRAAVQKVKKLEGQNVALKKSTQNAFSAAQTKPNGAKGAVKESADQNGGGDALEDFGKSAWITGQQFKTLWDSDPASAFQSFIVGLSKLNGEGESAIGVLDEISIKEVRLRDTMLRTVNTTDIFSRAQNMATSAWKKDAALSEEANKCYASTESMLKNLKNTFLRHERTDDCADHFYGARLHHGPYVYGDRQEAVQCRGLQGHLQEGTDPDAGGRGQCGGHSHRRYRLCAVICFYLSNEGLSLLENVAHIGLPISDRMKDVLAQLHGRTEEKKDDAQEDEHK